MVSRLSLPAGAEPTTLRRLLYVSGKPVFAFVSPTPLWKNLSTSLSSGSQRVNVAVLQKALKKQGYYKKAINGNFTSATKKAFMRWQKANGMSKTGVVDVTRFVWMPTGSVLTAWSVNLGSHVSSGTALASVVSPSRLSAEAQISQADIADLKVGQEAQMTIDGYEDDTFTGRISFISSEPASSSSASGSSTSTQYSITVSPEDLPKLAKSGMTGTLDIVIQQVADVLVVPTTAVSGSSTTSFVRVMQDGEPVFRQVQTGMATASSTEITSGLAEGETVVTGQYTDGADEHRRRPPRRRSGGGFRRRRHVPGGGFPGGGCAAGRHAGAGRRPVTVFLESLRLAFSSLRANPLRAFLTILGIVIGVAAVVALTSIGGGSTKAVVDRFDSFGTDTVTVQSSRFSSSSTAITQSDLEAIQDTPGVKTTVYTVDTNATVTYGSTTANASVTGTFPQYKAINHLTIKAGTFFTQFDVDHALPVAVLGSTTADDLGVAPLRADRPDRQRRRRALPRGRACSPRRAA